MPNTLPHAVYARRNKFSNVRTTVDGLSFASKREARRYEELKLLMRAGKIDNVELQPRYPLIVNGEKVCTYVADFRYLDRATRQTVVEDSKGHQTPEFKIKRKLMKACLGIDVTLT